MSHFNPLSPHDALKHHFTSLKTSFIFLYTTRAFRMKISMKLVNIGIVGVKIMSDIVSLKYKAINVRQLKPGKRTIYQRNMDLVLT